MTPSLFELNAHSEFAKTYAYHLEINANLAPDIVKAIWENRQPVSLTLDKLRRGIPESWEEQRKLFLAK